MWAFYCLSSIGVLDNKVQRPESYGIAYVFFRCDRVCPSSSSVESQIGLVDEGGRFQGLAGRFMGQLLSGQKT